MQDIKVAVANLHGPHRLVARTSRCGRDNPGSTPGVVIPCARRLLPCVGLHFNNVGHPQDAVCHLSHQKMELRIVSPKDVQAQRKDLSNLKFQRQGLVGCQAGFAPASRKPDSPTCPYALCSSVSLSSLDFRRLRTHGTDTGLMMS